LNGTKLDLCVNLLREAYLKERGRLRSKLDFTLGENTLTRGNHDLESALLQNTNCPSPDNSPSFDKICKIDRANSSSGPLADKAEPNEEPLKQQDIEMIKMYLHACALKMDSEEQ
jgi:hypothetical protein